MQISRWLPSWRSGHGRQCCWGRGFSINAVCPWKDTEPLPASPQGTLPVSLKIIPVSFALISFLFLATLKFPTAAWRKCPGMEEVSRSRTRWGLNTASLLLIRIIFGSYSRWSSSMRGLITISADIVLPYSFWPCRGSSISIIRSGIFFTRPWIQQAKDPTRESCCWWTYPKLQFALAPRWRPKNWIWIWQLLCEFRTNRW